MDPERHVEDQEGAFTNGPQIFSLEIEKDEEIDSLMKEIDGVIHAGNTSNGNNSRLLSAALSRNFNFRQRQTVTLRIKSTNEGFLQGRMIGTSIRGFLRSNIGNASSLRNFGLLAMLATCSLILVRVLNSDVSHQSLVTKVARQPHAPSLGGNLNSNHYQQQPQHSSVGSDDNYNIADDWYSAAMDRNSENDDSDDDSITRDAALPKSNVGAVVSSASPDNRDNAPGHYLHDPLKSPYSSPYYAAWSNNYHGEVKQQAEFEAKMALYASKYGSWTTPIWPPTLTIPDLSYAARNKDVNVTEFPPSAWQSNGPYVRQFLTEAKQLVKRVKEGIYEEYGYGVLNETSTAKKNSITAKRISEFQPIVSDHLIVADGVAITDKATGKATPGIAFLNKAAWEGLIRKLLHGMMTLDDFYVVQVGNSNTYAGNNLRQSSVMEFNNIMEPVFNRLGMPLISRNMGMNASTSISALGGADIYGEADIFWHVPDTRPGVVPETNSMVDLLHKQAILSGERVPVILTPNPVSILDSTSNTAWFGNLQPGANMCEPTTLKDGKTVVPLAKACRYVRCGPGADCDKHNSVCWIDRSDQKLPDQVQNKTVGHEKEGFPSYQMQRLEGRKLAMLVLHALDEALDRWIQSERSGMLPLPSDVWHVGPVYDKLRQNIREMSTAECGNLLRKLDRSICHMEMHAYTEWTPRVIPSKRLKSLLKRSIADNHASLVEVYTGVDLLPPQWSRDMDVDVHMIAIATDTAALPKGEEKNLVKVANDTKTLGYNDDVEWLHSPGDADEDFDYGFGDDGWSDDDMKWRYLSQRRHAITSDVSPKMWTVYNAPIGFCDGSAQSRCNRNVNNTCFLANYNHYRAGIIAHGQSGILSLSIPDVKEGVVLARFDWQLEDGPRVKFLPYDFAFEYTVNGVKKSMGRSEFATAAIGITGDLRVHVLLMDKVMSQKVGESKTIDIDLEVRANSTGLRPLILLSHIYYA